MKERGIYYLASMEIRALVLLGLQGPSLTVKSWL